MQCNAIEGLSSMGGIQGAPTDACIKILHANKITPILKWVDEYTFDYDLACIAQITDPLRIPWHLILKKGQDFGLSFKYLGFLWDLTVHSVSLPDEKHHRVLLKLNQFLGKPSVSWKDCASFHSSLQHICFVYQDAHCTLPALSAFLSKFPNDFVWHYPPCTVVTNLNLWLSCLTSPAMTCSLLLRQHLNLNIHLDASSSFGLSFAFENQYAGWCLIDSWAAKGQYIGWAESMALKLTIYWLIQRGFHDADIIVHSVNTGVIGAFLNGRSCNPA